MHPKLNRDVVAEMTVSDTEEGLESWLLGLLLSLLRHREGE